jgi:hypothetical protein
MPSIAKELKRTEDISPDRSGDAEEKQESVDAFRVDDGKAVDPMAEQRYVWLCYECGIFASSLLFLSLVRKIDLRVIPLSMVAYLVYFLDRSNIVSLHLGL